MNENKSDWTVDTLKEHIEKIFIEKDKAINIALAAAKEAVQVAEQNAEKWRANANEWRGAMTDREKNFMQKEEFLAYKEATEKALSREKTISDKSEGRGTGIKDFRDWVPWAIAVAMFLWKMFEA